MFDLMQYALIFYDFQLILARMGGGGLPIVKPHLIPAKEARYLHASLHSKPPLPVRPPFVRS